MQHRLEGGLVRAGERGGLRAPSRVVNRVVNRVVLSQVTGGRWDVEDADVRVGAVDENGSP